MLEMPRTRTGYLRSESLSAGEPPEQVSVARSSPFAAGPAGPANTAPHRPTLDPAHPGPATYV